MKNIAAALLFSFGLVGGVLVVNAAAAAADDGSYTAAVGDIEQTFGFVPTFMQQMPRAGFAGAWQQLKELEFSDSTALSPKIKALIALAVVSQIPCHYCIWADTASARQSGATDEEIAEAVAVAATERYWSTMLNGLQVDFSTFQKELGGLMGAETPTK
jgi:AhpD family alkylhydroperoxidase